MIIYIISSLFIIVIVSAMLFRKRASGTSIRLQCAKCGMKCNLGTNARVITHESAVEHLDENGVNPKTGHASMTLVLSKGPDMVMRGLSIEDSRKRDLNRVVNSLRNGQERNWKCYKCNHVQNYPKI